MASEIPIHHIKQNLCLTRPPYREGKRSRAVKVYTVNNESCYLIIQGVPSVGATQELSKLCSSFGPVEEFHPLDEYPCEDKYTEVYLVKFTKIQSARFAKRKLDDYSFFGGSLHVCYAPEHESVNETREKLQDRRRVIAFKIRQFATPTITDAKLKNKSSRVSVATRPDLSQPPQSATTVGDTPNLSHQATSSYTTKNLAGSHTLPTPGPVTAEETFELPPPPKEFVTRLNSSHSKPSRSVDRTANSSFKQRPLFAQSTFKPQQDRNVSKVSHNINSLNTAVKSSPQFSGPSSKKESVIVRNFQPIRTPPKFIPRQAMLKKESPLARVSDEKKILDEEIRKNAYLLGETQGPATLTPRKRDSSSLAEKSVNETIHAIRNKISKVISEEIKKM
ncbi:RNA-binding protein 48-like [Physella acuta]|uniref:RNA-binding protein 48-like n=1 Tax=Physella acuta TaxID=109671 RepID=UPI0027DB0CFF|nr:RNA-binding protein 48-like [Physella acuta]